MMRKVVLDLEELKKCTCSVFMRISIMAVWWKYRGIAGEFPCQARGLGVAGLQYKIRFLHGLPGHIQQQLFEQGWSSTSSTLFVISSLLFGGPLEEGHGVS